MPSFHKITIIKEGKPKEGDVNIRLQWFCKSFGMFTERDKEKSCYRIFVELLKHKHGLTSDELAKNANLSRGTTIHHLNRLMDEGLVVMGKGKYMLRVRSLKALVAQIEDDIDEFLDGMEETARKIDKELEF